MYQSLATRVPSTGKSQGPSLCVGLFISDNKSVTNKNAALMRALISPMKAVSSGNKEEDGMKCVDNEYKPVLD